VSNPSSDPSFVTGLLSDHLMALEQKILSANTPGTLDGLFAYHVTQGTTASRPAWDVSPVTNRWLDDNAGRLTNAPQLAALGYGLTYFTSQARAEADRHLRTGLQQLMRRDPYPADGVTFVHDLRQLIGIALACAIVRDRLPHTHDWLRSVVEDPRLLSDRARHNLVRTHVQGMLTDQAAILGGLIDTKAAADLALAHWMTAAGTTRLPDPVADLPQLQRRLLTGILHTRADDLSVPDAALLYTAGVQIINASIDQAVLNRNHVGVVLRRFEHTMRRWRYDDPTGANPIQWPITSEREVQDVLWVILRSAFDDLVDEEPLRKFGHSSYRPDFGLPRLGVLVEVKYVRSAAAFRTIEKEVFEDSVAYLKQTSTYKKLVVFIYDESSSVQEHETTAAALRELEHVIDVVIVCRPSQIPVAAAATTRSAGTRTKASGKRPSSAVRRPTVR
jgi:hypothetical protein